MSNSPTDPLDQLAQEWRGAARVLHATANPLFADAIESAKMLEGAGTLDYCAERLLAGVGTCPREIIFLSMSILLASHVVLCHSPLIDAALTPPPHTGADHDHD